MGETWLGILRGADGFEQRVCLKFIHESFRDTDQAGELFMREATIAASLRHSNIVGVIDADAHAGYMALELVDGTDLRTLLRAAPKRCLSAPVATCIAIELCKALEYAHTRTRGAEFAGIVHRDLSPGNVLISRAGEVKLADFGVAKVIRASGDVASAVRGKISYMSPEQMAGQSADARSDLFSLGVLIYELVSGRRPFDGENDADTIRRVMRGEYVPLPQRVPGLPHGLVQVTDRLLRTDPSARYPAAAAVIDALAPLAPPATLTFELAEMVQRARPYQTLPSPDSDSSVHSAPSSRGERPVDTRARTRRARRWFVLGLCLVAALGSIAMLRWVATTRDAISAPAAAVRGREPGAKGAAPLPVAPPALPPATPEPIAPPSAALAAAPEPAPLPPGEPEAPSAAPERVESSPTISPHGSSAGPAAPVVRSSPRKTVNLKVGVFPSGKVWLNGRLRGKAPLTLRQLAPGPYTIAVGIEAPTQSRAIVLEAGRDTRVWFDLQTGGEAGSP